MGEGRGDKHTHKQTDKHINTMTRPGLGAGPSENEVSRTICLHTIHPDKVDPIGISMKAGRHILLLFIDQ